MGGELWLSRMIVILRMKWTYLPLMLFYLYRTDIVIAGSSQILTNRASATNSNIPKILSCCSYYAETCSP